MSSDRPGYRGSLFSSEIVKLLIKTKGYDPTLAVRLVACKSGVGGKDSGAQDIANELNKHGNPNGVWAPIDNVVEGEKGQPPEAEPGHRYGWIHVSPNVK